MFSNRITFMSISMIILLVLLLLLAVLALLFLLLQVSIIMSRALGYGLSPVWAKGVPTEDKPTSQASSNTACILWFYQF